MPDNYTQHGSQEYKFNLPEGVIDMIPGMAVTELKPKFTPEFLANADGPSAQVEAVAECNDQMIDYDGSGFLLDEDDFRAAPSFTLGGRYYIFRSRGGSYKAGDFQKCDFTAVSWAKVNGAA